MNMRKRMQEVTKCLGATNHLLAYTTENYNEFEAGNCNNRVSSWGQTHQDLFHHWRHKLFD